MTPMQMTGHNQFIKMEAFNPGGSHKGRAARFIIRDLLDKGIIGVQSKKRILEKSGGNFGIGLALAAAQQGIKVDLVVAPHFSPLKRALCEQYGARLVGDELFRDGLNSRQVIETLLERTPDAYHFTDQFANDNNIRAHLQETGPEIAEQLKASGVRKDQPLFFVATAGTGASFSGISTILGQHFDNLHCIMVEPKGGNFLNCCWVCHKLDGAHVGEFPRFLDKNKITGHHWISDDEAFAGQRMMALDIGFFAGATSGGTYIVARNIARSRPDAAVVSIAYDQGEASLLQRSA
jgi:cysteine synthase